MQARDVAFAVQVVQFQNDGNKYARLSASCNAIPRDESTTVFANVETGTIRIVSKDAEVTEVVEGVQAGDSPANPAAPSNGAATVSVNFHGTTDDVADAISRFMQ